jgi:hypothetical protein
MSNAIRWSPEQLAAHHQRLAGARTPSPPDVDKLVRQDAARRRFQALGRLPKSRMNKTESRYAELLETAKRCGQIIDFRFHPMNVRLADNTFYEVDFLVLTAGLALEIHEVKGGYVTDKGAMKIKLCAEVLPWFRMVKASERRKKDGGGWEFKEF